MSAQVHVIAGPGLDRVKVTTQELQPGGRWLDAGPPQLLYPGNHAGWPDLEVDSAKRFLIEEHREDARPAALAGLDDP